MGTIKQEIGIFYRLPGNRYVAKKADYRAIEPENGFRDIPSGHLEFFEKEVYPKYAPKIPADRGLRLLPEGPRPLSGEGPEVHRLR
jgi:hypothetical protein